MKNLLFLTLIIFIACKGPVTSRKEHASIFQKNSADSVYIDHTTLPKDSSYFCEMEIDFKLNKTFPVNSEIAAAYGYSHLAMLDYYELKKNNLADKMLILTDSFAVIHPSKLLSDRIELSKTQINSLLSILNGPSNFGEGEASCFYPRHTFIFLNKKMKVSGIVEICFECSQIYLNPLFSNSVSKYGRLNITGSKKLESFCNQIGMTLDL
jgi:hypothetical protein